MLHKLFLGAAAPYPYPRFRCSVPDNRITHISEDRLSANYPNHVIWVYTYYMTTVMLHVYYMSTVMLHGYYMSTIV